MLCCFLPQPGWFLFNWAEIRHNYAFFPQTAAGKTASAARGAKTRPGRAGERVIDEPGTTMGWAGLGWAEVKAHFKYVSRVFSFRH